MKGVTWIDDRSFAGSVRRLILYVPCILACLGSRSVLVRGRYF
jgi:hypothetical protein